MVQKEDLFREIESLPQNLLEEVAEFIGYLKQKNSDKRIDITVASEFSLGKDWLKSKEDEAWRSL
jgi:hypothetical protein